VKKIIVLLIFGLIFRLTSLYGAGNSEITAAQETLLKEVDRLAVGVDFSKPAEVKKFETILKGNGIFKEYMVGVKTVWGSLISDDYVIAQIIDDRRSKYIEKQKTNIAETWSVKNVTAGTVLFDLAMQQRIMTAFEQNMVKAKTDSDIYIDKTFQYVGQIISVERKTSFGNTPYFQMHLRRTNGVTVFAEFNIDQAESVQKIKKDDVIVVSGKCRWFLESSSMPLGLSSVRLEDCVIKFVAN